MEALVEVDGVLPRHHLHFCSPSPPFLPSDLPNPNPTSRRRLTEKKQKQKKKKNKKIPKSSKTLAMSSSSNGAPSPSSFDHVLIQSLLSRLQLRPPYLDSNSLIDTNFLNSDSDDDVIDGGHDDDDRNNGHESKNRKLIAKEEAKLEREIIKIVNSGKGDELLKPNSGQSVSIGDNNVCVGVHDEKGSEYRVWEWHGHIMFFDEEDGYSAEYVYGNYFERVVEKKKKKEEEEEEEEEEDVSRVKGEGNSGLRDLIEGEKGTGAARVVHRGVVNLVGALASEK